MNAVAEDERPQSIDIQRLALLVGGLTFRITHRIKSIDHPVAEISNPEIAAQRTEARRRKHHAPRRVEVATGREAFHEHTVGREDVYVTRARLMNRVVLRHVLHGV